MDTMRISGVPAGAEILVQCNSLSRLVARRCADNGRWKTRMFPARSRNWRPSVKRRFPLVVKSISSEPKEKVVDAVIDSEQEVMNPFAPDAASVASSIKYHAEFTPLFSPEKFELPKAFFATAQSVRDALIMNWNATYEYYNRVNVKQAYYLSMEFLQGRALSNAVGNLGLNSAYGDALKRLGFDLETVASQEPDPALGNGGLGRLIQPLSAEKRRPHHSIWNPLDPICRSPPIDQIQTLRLSQPDSQNPYGADLRPSGCRPRSLCHPRNPARPDDLQTRSSPS
ncbi:PREDICTED: alpha-glucan phosphorylase 1-like [Camelina sativa]|uniref:Alpha-glucan phosphorylase 1-like n=1 Tax=Camelina sativa TaxID=90675 RepID=A0ABM0YWY4_CAMSA|nr:PREDICTED: alpha-glucan phosphorylase 1-like [Camelina sativa]